jgi:hypothetical protein
MKLRLPRKFYEDHEERDLPSGTVLSRTQKRVLIEADQDTVDEILSDAKYYSNEWGPDCIERSLKVSALNTVKAILKQIKLNKS